MRRFEVKGKTLESLIKNKLFYRFVQQGLLNSFFTLSPTVYNSDILPFALLNSLWEAEDQDNWS